MLTATRTRMPGTAEQVREARRWLSDWLGADHPATYAAVQLLSETFGNSVLYARPGGEVEVLVERGDDAVRVELIDAGGNGDPLPGRHPDESAESGRGLFILDFFAKEWGWERLPDERLRFWYTVVF